VLSERMGGANLVEAHEPRIARHVSGHNSCQSSPDPIAAQARPPQDRKVARSDQITAHSTMTVAHRFHCGRSRLGFAVVRASLACAAIRRRYCRLG
jgi:hypothetical protein